MLATIKQKTTSHTCTYACSHPIVHIHILVCVVPKVRHPGGSAFCWRLGLPEQTMGWLVSPLGFGICVADDKLLNFHVLAHSVYMTRIHVYVHVHVACT